MSLGNITSLASAGSESDPLITLSYLEQRISEVKRYVDDKTSSSNNSNLNKLEVIELKNGQKLIGREGTEIILRSGKATAKVSDLGGISDVTDGVDLKEGESIPKNHQLIIPRDDGRGLIIIQDSTFVLVRGEYIIE
ncbi:hypothetical protein E8P77_01740 [Soehngenia saccharolytica]|nr:hypothetical protein E8P77_01740 [Soehngenia saccharolytica]